MAIIRLAPTEGYQIEPLSGNLKIFVSTNANAEDPSFWASTVSNKNPASLAVVHPDGTRNELNFTPGFGFVWD